MTDFHVNVVRIGDCIKHPNADSLSITHVGSFPVIFRTGDYSPGDLAVYVPEESVVPVTDPRWMFLDGKDRIRARKLRGVFSCGLLTPVEPGMQEGDDVAEKLRIVKYLTIEERHEFGSQAFHGPKKENVCPDYLPRYTDIENLRRHPNIFAPSQTVVATEKCEGESCGYAYNEPTFWQKIKSWFGAKTPNPVLCRSRNQMKTSGKWYDIIEHYDLEDAFLKLDDPEGYSIYGESYGYTKNFNYDDNGRGSFRVFDVYDRVMKRYLDLDEAYHVCEAMGLPMMPILYRGPYDKQLLEEISEGDSSFGDHMMEGLIVRSETEQNVPHFGRLITKLKSQRYLLRKD